ncbi:alpha/beta fold hydrolase [Paracraurococcus lichenis]|uniref:Alpha/beta fold hydrolase n=1 Tax=Paracraurococcus lichenis TaxID=3064888 RepID=A0ABT9DTB2_9PROT|nr:alpha/beta fold hydrolase [Paracraurococcus sp. LOR1-02]MDO9707129.1 alpha/beta fold hydrolase [Paracraurococcus sp. LOR1-02]
MIRHAAAGPGLEIAYAVTGEGPPLLLLHGGEADHTQYDGFVPHLAPHFACIACDQRDSGQTRNPDTPYGIEALADDAAALIAALGHARAHVFGSSLGSVIAQALAVRHPARIDRLVLSAAIRIGRSIADINPEAAAELGRLRADPEANAARIARWFYPEAHLAAHPELARRFAGGTRNPAQRARRNALIPQAPLLDLSGIAAPTLVLAQAEDRLVPPAHSLSIAAEIPGARSIVLEGLGHVGTIQAPERIAAAITPFLLGH